MNTPWSRREFLGTAGASLAAAALGPLPQSRIPAPGTVPAPAAVRFGMIGVGMQGSWLLPTAVQLPGVECAAACDLYDGRHTLAREIVRPDLPVTRRYQDLLNDKSIDCIVAAVPDHWHKQVVVDAVNAGKDIYCEKPMSHNAADGVAIVDAQRKTGRIVQIGSQRVSSQICAKAKELIAQAGSATLCSSRGGSVATIPPARGSIRRRSSRRAGDRSGAPPHPRPADERAAAGPGRATAQSTRACDQTLRPGCFGPWARTRSSRSLNSGLSAGPKSSATTRRQWHR